MSHYIVPSAMLKTNPPTGDWHAHGIPVDPTQSLLVVVWSNPNAEMDFEALPGVLFLGEPWEPLPPEAVPLLASFQDSLQSLPSGAVALPVDGLPITPDTVSQALRKLSWPGARLR